MRCRVNNHRKRINCCYSNKGTIPIEASCSVICCFVDCCGFLFVVWDVLTNIFQMSIRQASEPIKYCMARKCNTRIVEGYIELWIWISWDFVWQQHTTTSHHIQPIMCQVQECNHARPTIKAASSSASSNDWPSPVLDGEPKGYNQ
jgi:hypothetical protein